MCQSELAELFAELTELGGRRTRSVLSSETDSTLETAFRPFPSATRKYRCIPQPAANSLGEIQQLKKGVFGKGSFRNLCAELWFCVFLCSERIFVCKSHRNFFQKLPLQCRHFLENPLAKNPKTQLLRDLSKNLSSKSIVFRSFSAEGTLWDSSRFISPEAAFTPPQHSSVAHTPTRSYSPKGHRSTCAKAPPSENSLLRTLLRAFHFKPYYNQE